jgi:hypothetical protein
MKTSNKEIPVLDQDDWVEIYYALEFKAKSAVVDGDKKWRIHLNEIMKKIGPDGENMYPEVNSEKL